MEPENREQEPITSTGNREQAQETENKHRKQRKRTGNREQRRRRLNKTHQLVGKCVGMLCNPLSLGEFGVGSASRIMSSKLK
jgi:hypothetical protein